MRTPAPQNGTVVVVGSINMDLVFFGLADLPTPRQTVSARRFETLPGGKGANQASADAAVGAEVQLFEAAGIDSLGDAAISDLRARGVGLSHVMRVSEPTGVAA
ncbi:MAG: PfkB family carbohydrate kinase, partial [Salinibacterium sp.]|nr:PfkB family carbohydrate kinase [Salinibacterium sp.]